MLLSFSVLQQEDFVPKLLRTLRAVSEGATIGDGFHPHEIACIFLVLAIGSHFSGEPNGHGNGEKYYLLGCAALSLTPLVKEATSTTIQALFVMVQYFNCIDGPGCERRWLLSSVMFRLAYSVRPRALLFGDNPSLIFFSRRSVSVSLSKRKDNVVFLTEQIDRERSGPLESQPGGDAAPTNAVLGGELNDIRLEVAAN